MKMKKIAAMMALATMLTSGVTAHADVQQGANHTQILDGFAADLQNGQIPSQSSEIEINGTFNKQATNLPDPQNDGHYLYVTMPIKLDFTYDVDTDVMVSPEGKIMNQSFYAENTNQNANITPKKVKMTIENLTKNIGGTNSLDLKFVDQVNPTDKAKVQAPFKLSILDENGVSIISHNLSEIENNGVRNNPITINEDQTVKLKLEKITGQTLGNKELIQQGSEVTSHALELKFEYVD